jgi:hypothetical protein
MPTFTYFPKRGEFIRLEITWSSNFKNTIVRFDGKPIGSVPTRQELEAGKSFPLGGGSEVKVQLRKTWIGYRIKVESDGRPLPESPSRASLILRGASNVIFFIAGLNLLFGVFVITVLAPTGSQSQSAGSLDLGLGGLFGGLLYLVLGFFTRRGSKVALLIAGAVYALNFVLNLVLSVTSPSNPSLGSGIGLGGILIGIWLLREVRQGVRAIDAIRAEEKTIQQQAQ